MKKDLKQKELEVSYKLKKFVWIVILCFIIFFAILIGIPLLTLILRMVF